MSGKFSDFTNKAKDLSKSVLSQYRPEIELALGPAKVTLRAVKVQENDKDKEEELSL